MKNMLTLVIAILAVGFTIGCSKKKGGSAAATTSYYLNNNVCYNSSNTQVDYNLCSGVTYMLQNGQCYQRSNMSVVAITNCPTGTGTNNGYSIVNGQCVHSSNPNVYVSMTLCQTTGNNGTCYNNGYAYQCGNNGSGSCNGRQLGFYNNYGQMQIITCGYQWDCRGVTMYDVYNGYRQVYCN